MTKKNKYEYFRIVNDIVTNENYLKIKNDIHHGTNKYSHCLRVSKMAYKISKQMNLDYVSAARAGMLHDFFYGSRKSSIENSYFNHPITSLTNAKKYFEINELEEDIIIKHMFPSMFIKSLNPLKKINLSNNLPKYRESWVVCFSDVLVSFEEFIRFKLSYNASVIMLFLINFVTTH